MTEGSSDTPSAAADQPVALFDFDETITTVDSLRLFLDQVTTRGQLGRTIARSPLTTMGALAGGSARDRLKERVTHTALAGRVETEVNAIAEGIGAELIDGRLRGDVLERIAWHHESGHRVLIVSASFEAYIKPVAAHLGISDIVATKWEVQLDGRLSGRLLGGNVRRRAKVDRVLAHLGERPELVYGYGDSKGDREMLEFSDVATWVRSGIKIPRSG